jgi:hypothetical protein
MVRYIGCSDNADTFSLNNNNEDEGKKTIIQVYIIKRYIKFKLFIVEG